jgi:hypothetical protein
MVQHVPAKCEVRAVIRFLYGEDVINRKNVAKWCCEFEAGRSYVHDEIRSGKPSVVTDEIIRKTDENICADRRLTIDELPQQCSEVSRIVLHEIVTKRLGYWKLCAHWVCRMIMTVHTLLMPCRSCCSP